MSADQLAERAAKSPEITRLVELAGYFQRAANHGPFTVDLPLHCAVSIPKKGYRRTHIPAGTKVTPDTIYLGKKQGLIFRFAIVGELKRNGETIESLEVGWEDVANAIPEFHARMNVYYGSDSTKSIWLVDTAVKSAIDKNPAMHIILSDGFKKAQETAREQAAEADQDNPLWGSF